MKRIFATLLVLIGVGSLIYSAVLFVNTIGGTSDINTLIVYYSFGFILLIPGIVLLMIKDESIQNPKLNIKFNSKLFTVK